MNQEEILNMPAGQDMDLLVADEVLKLSADEWNNRFFFSTGNKTKFSVDMSAAWEVVEKIAGEDSELSAHITGEYAGHGWRCVFGNAFVDYDVTAKTAPLAICRAALLAVMPR